MQKFPKLTIISPSLNQAEFIEQTIQSVVSQNYPNLEYLIFDGGSTDGSLRIIQKYAKKYPQIKLFYKKDKGQVDAINQGIKKSSGEIVAYINSDDFYLPNSFQKVVNFFRKNPQKRWLIGNCNVSQNNLKWTFALKEIAPVDKTRVALEIYNPINQPAVFLKRELIKKVGLLDQDYRYAFDYDYWLRCSKISLPGRLKKPLAVFRVHKTSLGSSGYTEQLEEDINIAKEHTKNVAVLFIHKLINLTAIIYYKIVK